MDAITLERLKSRVATTETELVEEHVQNVFMALRFLNDERPEGTRLKTVRLYADWCSHQSLDKKGAAGVLKTINEASIISDADPKIAGRAINEAFSLRSLRAEAIQLISKEGIDPSRFHSKSSWTSFLVVLLKFLTNRPLLLDEKGSEAAEASVLEGKLPIISAGISWLREADLTVLHSIESYEHFSGRTPMWTVGLGGAKPITVSVKVGLPEAASAFRDP